MTTNLSKNASVMILAAVGQKVLTFVYFTILARWLSVEAFGSYSYVLSLVAFWGLLVDGGFSQWLPRQVAKEPDKSKWYLKLAIAKRLPLALLSIAITLSLPFFIPAARDVWPLLLLASSLYLTDTFVIGSYSVLRGLHIFKFEAVGIVGTQLISTILGLGLLIFVKSDPFLVILAVVIANILNATFAYITAKRKTKNNTDHEAWPWSKIIKMLWPFLLAIIATRVFQNIDSILIGTIAGAVVLAQYALPIKILNALQFLPMAISSPLYTTLTSLWRKDNHAQFFASLFLVFRSLALVGFGITMSMILSAKGLIPWLFTDKYILASLVVQVFSIGVVVTFLEYPFGAALNATGHEKRNTWHRLILVGLSVIGNLIMLPLFGLWGAVLVALVSLTIFWLLNFITAARLLKLNLPVYLSYLFSLFCCALLVILGLYWLNLPWWLNLVFSLTAYTALVLIFRLLKFSEIKELIKNLRAAGSNYEG